MQREAFTDDAWSAAIAAAILRRGAMVHAASLVLTMAALVTEVAASFVATKPGVAWLSIGIAIVLLGVVELWLAGRVALDAELFDAIAARNGDLAGFDRAMLALRLMPRDKAKRGLGPRIEGALRLLKLQVLTLVAQLSTLLAGALWA